MSDDGNVENIAPRLLTGYLGAVAAAGQLVINDAGGAYRVGLDGQFTRISSGKILAATATHLLIRECDDARSCTVVVESYGDGARVTVEPAAAQLLSESYGVSMSPDGTAAAYVSARDFERPVIVDLASGEQVTTTVPFPDLSSPSLWAGDGSGMFVIVDPQGLTSSIAHLASRSTSAPNSA